MKIAEQPFHLLVMLLERPGEVLTRQELEQALWPGQTELDRADNLNTAIKKVRIALDDQAERPRYIETLPRRGYCFIGRVDGSDGHNASIGSNAPPIRIANSAGLPLYRGTALDAQPVAPRTSAQLAFRTWKRAAVAAGAIAGVLFAAWWLAPLPRPRITRIDQVTYSARIDTPVKPVIEGENVYYIQRAGDHWDLMETMLGEGDGRRIHAPGKSAMVLDVSPDHTKLLDASFQKRDGNDELWMVPSEGGTANRMGIIAPSAAFSPDGKRIAYANTRGVFVMDADGLKRRKLVDLGTLATWLSWSPRGRHLRFTMSAPADDGRQSIWQISKNGNDLRELPLQPASTSSVCCGSWTSGGRYYIYSAEEGGQWDIWAVREQSSWRRHPWHTVQLTFGPNSAISPEAAPDGEHIFYYSGVLRQEMQRFDLHTREFEPIRAVADDLLISYSRDGNWIAYVDAETGALVRSRADGTHRLQLAPSEVAPQFPRWSPDGNSIVFEGLAPTGREAAYLVATIGGPLQQLLPDEKEVRDPDWSVDGRKIVASRALADESGTEVVVVSIATERAERVPGSDQLAATRWSPDGRYISATSDDQTKLKLFDISAKRWQVIARGEALGIGVWSPDARYLYFQDLLGPGEQLRRYDLKTRTIQTVVDFSDFLRSGISRCALIAVAPDGAPIVAFNRSSYDLFSAEVTLP